MLSITNALRARGIGVGKKPTGDALPGDLRAGKKAMSAIGEIIGTVPVQVGGNVVPGTADIVKPSGIYDTPITVKGVVVPAADVLTGTTIAGTVGTMPNNGTWNATPGASAITIPGGRHSGAGIVNAVAVDASKVLSGTTIAGQAGTMPNRGAVTIIPSASAQTIAAGYHNGSGSVPAVAGLAANVIKKDSVVGGVTGTYAPVEFVLIQANTYRSGNTVLPGTAVKRVTMTASGTFRFTFTLRHTNGGYENYSYGRIWKNGVEFGIGRSSSDVGVWKTFTEDLAVNAGDVIELYLARDFNNVNVFAETDKFEITNTQSSGGGTVNLN